MGIAQQYRFFSAKEQILQLNPYKSTPHILGKMEAVNEAEYLN